MEGSLRFSRAKASRPAEGPQAVRPQSCEALSDLQSLDALLREFDARVPRALARAISWAEAGRGAELIRRIFSRTGRAMSIGLTGPPGVGKSTLASAIVRKARSLGKSVGVVSVDPSSPFSHGALLGDRIRLTEHFVDADVFIRSMASRGHLGGVAGATADAVLLMDAFGLDVVLVETVGVGQSEIEIAELAQTTLVALQPGSGDSVQVLKAGIMEIADIFVVNKADHPMANMMRKEIRGMMEMLQFPGWVPELVMTQALEGKGIDELWTAIERHLAYLNETGEIAEKRLEAFTHQVRQLALGRLEKRLEHELREGIPPGIDPYEAADRILSRFGTDDGAEDKAHTARPRAFVKGLT
jgi:LAO/AO transport system kinase